MNLLSRLRATDVHFGQKYFLQGEDFFGDGEKNLAHMLISIRQTAWICLVAYCEKK
jgi:hypothetical protein